MSWSDLTTPDRSFTLGLGLTDAPDAPASPPPSGGPGLITSPAFVTLPDPEDRPGLVRPMVFASFDAPTDEPAVAVPDPSIAAIDELEVVEAEELEPPPDVEAIKAAAWSEGFQAGYEEGLRLAAEEQRETIDRLGALVQGIVTETETFVRGLENQVVELALAVAEKVIAREVQLDPAVVVDVVRAALAEVYDATELRIRVNPDDLALVEAHWEAMLPRNVAQQSELRADGLVERGGVVVETRIGYVDGQLKTRINQVVTSFQAVLDGEPV